MTQSLTLQETIDKVIFNFDFDKVMKVMKALDWKWHDSVTEDGVPSTGEVVSLARRLLEDVVAPVKMGFNDHYSIATGGFTATANRYEDGEILITLQFVVTDFNYSNADTCY